MLAYQMNPEGNSDDGISYADGFQATPSPSMASYLRVYQWNSRTDHTFEVGSISRSAPTGKRPKPFRLALSLMRVSLAIINFFVKRFSKIGQGKRPHTLRLCNISYAPHGWWLWNIDYGRRLFKLRQVLRILCKPCCSWSASLAKGSSYPLGPTFA